MQGRKGTFSEEIFFDSMLKSSGDMIETLTSITQALDSYVNNASILSIICTIKDHSLKEKAMNYYNRSISKIQNIACFYSSFLFFYNKSLFQNNNLNLKDLKVTHIIEIGVSLEKMVEIYNQLSEKSLLKKNLAPMIQDVLKVSGILERLVTLLRPVLHNDKTIAENIVLLKEEKLKNDVFNYCALYNQEVKKLVTRYPYFHTSFYESCKNISMMEPEKITFNTLNQWKLALISHQENFEKIQRNERSLKFDTHNIVELKKLLQARDQKEKVASTVEYKDLAEEHTRHELIGEVQYEYEHDEETNRHRKVKATRKCKHCGKEVEIELTEEEKQWKACSYGEEKTDSEGNKYQECSVCGHKKYVKEECKHGELEKIQRNERSLKFDTHNIVELEKLLQERKLKELEKIQRNGHSLKFNTHNIVELEKLLQERKLKELEKIQRNRHSLKFDTHNIVELKKLLQARDQKEKVASTVEYKDLAEEHTRHELIGEVQYEYEHDEETNRHRKVKATRKCKHCGKEVEIELTEEEKQWKACSYGEEKTDSEGNKYQECSVCGHKKYEKEECKQHGELENIQRSRHLLTFDKQKIFSNIFELKKLLKCKLKELKKLLQARDQKEKVASTVEYKDLAEEHTRHELIGEVQYEYEHDEETNRHRKVKATRKCKHCGKEVEIELTEEEKQWKACSYGEEKTDSEGNKYQECSVCGHKKYVKEECKHGELENITQKVIWNKDTKTHNIIRKNDNDPWYENENIFFDEPTFRAYIEKPNKISESDFNFIENFSNFQQTEDYEFCKNIEYPFTTKDCLLSQRLKDNLNENWILWRTEDLFNALNYYDSEAYNSLFDPETTYNDYNGFNR